MGWFQRQPAASQPLKSFNQAKYDTARHNLLLMIAFTAINVILRLVQADLYFLFSASIPLAVLDIATLFTTGVSIPAVVIAVAVVVVYLVCWILSKKRTGWLIAAMVLFALDTLAMFLVYEIGVGMLLDIVFHAYVLFYLISGTVAAVKLRTETAAPAEPVYQPMAYAPEAAYPPVEGIDPADTAQSVVMVNGEAVAIETQPTEEI